MNQEPDPHFGSDEDMRAWANRENLQLIYEDENRTIVNWHAVYANWLNRLRQETNDYAEEASE